MKVPAGWSNTLLHNVAEIRTGLSKSAKREGPTVRKPYLRVANVQDGFLDLSEIKEIDVPSNQVARFTLKSGDMLLIEGNGNPENLGRGCIWDGQIQDCVHQNHIFAVRTLPSSGLFPSFLALQLQSDHGRNYLLSCAKGSTGLSTLNSGQLKLFPLLVPPIREQRQIAKIILTWDNAIETTETLIVEKQLHRKGLMQQLLTGKRRLPGFGKPAVGDNLPEGWQRPKTEEVFQNISRKNRPGETVLSVTQDEGVVPRDRLDRKINMDHENTHTYKLVKPGDFVISLRSFQGGLEYSRHRGLVSPAYHVIRAKVDISDDFYRHYFKSPEFIQRLAIATIGIRDGKQISYGDFSFMRLPVPPVKEQQAIAEVINRADHELELLQAKANSLREQKKGLMQQLLTGKKRVKV